MRGHRSVCKDCHKALEVYEKRCSYCYEIFLLNVRGPCTECTKLGKIRGSYCKGLCLPHYRKSNRNMILDATGYAGNEENGDDFTALIEGIIEQMITVLPQYQQARRLALPPNNQAALSMGVLINLARGSLRPRVYDYIVKRVNREAGEYLLPYNREGL